MPCRPTRVTIHTRGTAATQPTFNSPTNHLGADRQPGRTNHHAHGKPAQDHNIRKAHTTFVRGSGLGRAWRDAVQTEPTMEHLELDEEPLPGRDRGEGACHGARGQTAVGFEVAGIGVDVGEPGG
jgi:hypothetical protein